MLRDPENRVVAFRKTGDLDRERFARRETVSGLDAFDRHAGRRHGNDGPLRVQLVDRLVPALRVLLDVVAGRIRDDLAVVRRDATAIVWIHHELRDGIAAMGERHRGGGIDDDFPRVLPRIRTVCGVELDTRARGDDDIALEGRDRIVDAADPQDFRDVGDRRLPDDVPRTGVAVVVLDALERDAVQDRKSGSDGENAVVVVVEEADRSQAKRARAGHGAARVALEMQVDAALVAAALVGADDRDVGIIEHHRLAVALVAIDADRGVVREGDDRRLRRDVADIPVGCNVPVVGSAADPRRGREADGVEPRRKDRVGDDRDRVGRHVDAVGGPAREHVAEVVRRGARGRVADPVRRRPVDDPVRGERRLVPVLPDDVLDVGFHRREETGR